MENKDLKKLQEYLLDILKDFVKICDKYNLTYYLAYGTVIGAIRHKGFIPWDDDVDVCMPIPDYLKFTEIAPKELDEKYFLQTIETDKYYNQLWAKIRLNNTCMVETSNINSKAHQGIFIDVFPLIPYPNDTKLAIKQDKRHQFVKIYLEKDMGKDWKKKYYGKKGYILSTLIKPLPKKMAKKLALKQLRKMFSFFGEYDNYLTFGPAHYFPREAFNTIKVQEFAGEMFNIPGNYDIYLKKIYGNYMELPPIEDRKGHSPSFLSFDKNYEEIKKELDK